MMNISVVIPTYNRKEKLKKVLKALSKQKFSQIEKVDFEIVVVDDGSTDGTRKEILILGKKSSVPIRYFRQNKKGPAAARNLGVKEAGGKVVLFLGSDIMASPSLVEEHFLSHKKYPDLNVAILGFTTWAKDLEVTPFMWWMEHGGHQFKYNEIEDKMWVNYRYFFTSNISLKRDFLLKNGSFCEEFHDAAYEDLELGYRLEQKGLKIFHNRKAIAYHDHYTDIDTACQRMEEMGKWSVLYNRKVPRSRRLPHWIAPLILLILGDPMVYFFLHRTALWCEKRIAFPLVFNTLLLTHYAKGRTAGGIELHA